MVSISKLYGVTQGGRKKIVESDDTVSLAVSITTTGSYETGGSGSVGSISFADTGSNTAVIKAPNTIANTYELVLPDDLPVVDSVLKVDTLGVISYTGAIENDGLAANELVVATGANSLQSEPRLLYADELSFCSFSGIGSQPAKGGPIDTYPTLVLDYDINYTNSEFGPNASLSSSASYWSAQLNYSTITSFTPFVLASSTSLYLHKGVSAGVSYGLADSDAFLTVDVFNGNIFSAYNGSNYFRLGLPSSYSTYRLQLPGAAPVKGQTLVADTTENLVWKTTEHKITTVNSINLETVANTLLFTPGTGETYVITKLVLRYSSESAVTVVPTVSAGVNSTDYNNVVFNISLDSFTTATNVFVLPTSLNVAIITDTLPLYFKVISAATAVDAIISIDVFGYLI